MNINNDLRKFLLDYRHKHNLTQKELAGQLKIAYRTYQDAEMGKVGNYSTMQKIMQLGFKAQESMYEATQSQEQMFALIVKMTATLEVLLTMMCDLLADKRGQLPADVLKIAEKAITDRVQNKIKG